MDYNEDLLEQLYWEFDHLRKTASERDVFKGKMRYYAGEILKLRDNKQVEELRSTVDVYQLYV